MLNLTERSGRTSRAGVFAGFSLVIALAVSISGCFGGNPGVEPPHVSRTFNPKVKEEFDLDDWAWADRQDQVISPDGKYALLILNNENGQNVGVVPLEGEERTPLILYSAPSGWVEGSSLFYRTLGWTKSGNPLFIAWGYQNQGPNVGKRGVALLSGDLKEGVADEIAFIDLPSGELHTSTYVPAANKIFLTVSGAVWAYDLGAKKLSQVKGGLPTYDGLFYPRLSPDGRYLVYELVEEGKSGVYLLDARSGEEKALLPNGETMSFIPQWSPDGRFIAAYTVDRKAGTTGTSRDNYVFIPGEDGPMTISAKITVINTSGKVVRTISLPDKVLSSFRWSGDSKSLAFVTGPLDSLYSDPSPYYGMPLIPWDGLWTVPVEGQEAPVRLAALEPPTGEEPSFIYPLAFDAQNKGVYYQFSEGESVSVLYAGPGTGASAETPPAPSKISDGYWHFQHQNPVFREYTAALITQGTQTELWFLGPDFRKANAWSTITTVLLGYNDDTILVFRRGETRPSTITVVSVFDE